MKILKNKVFPFFLASLVFTATNIVFAKDSFGSGEFIWKKDANVYVKYAKQDSSRFGENDHPAELTENDIRAILQSIRKQDKEGKTVFTDRQAEILGKTLARGLREAKPNQDIVFVLNRESPRPLGLKPNIYYLSGRAFYKDGRLNLIIGDYDLERNVAYETVYDPTNVGIARYNFNHGKRSVGSSLFNSQIVDVEGVQTMQSGDSQRNDWFLIDVGTASTAVSQLDVGRGQAEGLRHENTTPAALRSSAQTAPSRTSAPASTPTPSTTAHPVEERLTVLKRLRDKGLITEQEFVKKRKGILEDL